MPVAQLRSVASPLSQDFTGTTESASFVANSDVMRRALHRLDCFAVGPHAVLLEGESGTGKSYFARALHARSARAGKPFGTVNLAGLDETLANSELFGHVAGAYTGAHRERRGHFMTCAGGTLFLDEVGKAPLGVQRKLLHAVEAGEIQPLGADRPVHTNVRLVFATSVPLATLVEDGTLLSDLKPRLGPLHLRIPALRERPTDIPDLVWASIARAAPYYGYSRFLPDVESDLMTAFVLAPWVGNHRELDATLIQLVSLAEKASAITLAMCDDGLAYLRALVEGKTQWTPQEAVDAVRRAGGNQARGGRTMGLSPMQIGRLLARAKVGG